jgi:DNA polymerase-3 subunit epsilon
MRTLYLDVATTGIVITKDRIVEIGITEAVNGKLTGQNFHHYIFPENSLMETCVAEINGYDLNFLIGKPSFTDIVEELIGFIDGAEVVSVLSAFDVGFLNAELRKVKKRSLKFLCCKITDLFEMAKKSAPTEPAILSYLLKKYQVQIEPLPELPSKLRSTLLLYKLHTLMKANKASCT